MPDRKKKSQWLGKLLKYGIPLVVSAGLCYLLFTGIDFRQMLDIVRTQCNYLCLILRTEPTRLRRISYAVF